MLPERLKRPCSDVRERPAFSMFFHEKPTCVQARIDETVSQHLADPLVDELADREAGASGLLHVRRE
jgi:hypothetical protein